MHRNVSTSQVFKKSGNDDVLDVLVFMSWMEYVDTGLGFSKRNCIIGCV